jgi:tetratricopeptide (TPR) repeat protein
VEKAAAYYQALALERLGQADRAKAIFAQLVDAGTARLGDATETKESSQSGVTSAQHTQIADAHYVVGLGQLGLNNREQAREEFTLALESSPDHYAAERALSGMTP